MLFITINPVFSLFIFSHFLLSSYASILIMNEPFQSTTYVHNFNMQCSYDDPGCKEHFALATLSSKEYPSNEEPLIEDPENGSNFLRVAVHADDLEFQKGSTTEPRSELRSKLDLIKPRTLYTITWNVNIQKYTTGYYFCFAQIFDPVEGPNIMLRWQRDEYELWVDGTKTILKGTLDEDLHHTTTWRLTVRLDSSNGLVKVERKRSSDSVFRVLGEKTGKTIKSGGGEHYVKLGIYTQHVDVEEMDMYVNKLTIIQD